MGQGSGEILLAKIGGSTLGGHDTTMQDLVDLQRRGLQVVVVHGGGARISQWLARHNVPTRFERGLRVTDAESLEVVTAVLAGLVNKDLVSSLTALGARAAGISGADGGILRGRVIDEKLGYVGEVSEVDADLLRRLLDGGYMPVMAPVGGIWNEKGSSGQLLNINADTAAGAVAKALGARWLVFLTDVSGVNDAAGSVLSSLTAKEAQQLIEKNVIDGGMIPKVEACLAAASEGSVSVIADGRNEHALLKVVAGETAGTVVG